MDPTLRTKITNDLKAILPDLPRGLRTAAKYIVDQPSDFGLDSICETARKVGVSTYTLVRLAERTGFSGYDELREPFRHALVSATAQVDSPEWVDRLREDGALGQTQATASLNAVATVQRSLERQMSDQMRRVVTMLLEGRTVYVTAMRASYGMAYYLHYVGRMVLPNLHLIPRHMSSAIDELHTAGPGDVLIAITVTPYSRETIEACRFAIRKGVKLILISDSDIISPDFSADETLIVSSLSTHHMASYVGTMAVIETLIAILVAEAGEPARARIKSYEELRRANQAYWAAKKKH